MEGAGSFHPGVVIRRRIVTLLEKRNRREKEPYGALIETYNRLFDAVSELRHEVLQLTIHNEKLRQENLLAPAADGKTCEKTSVLEQKIFSLQEELTDLHRRKGEHAQQIVDLSGRLQEAEKNLAAKDIQLSDALTTVTLMKEVKRNLEVALGETQQNNQTLKDEHQALHIAFAALEAQVKQLQAENIDLVQRLVSYKALDAELLNKDNENFRKCQQAKMRQELEEAANEVRLLSLAKADANGPLVSSELPSKVHCKFEAHDGEVNALHFNRAGRVLATGGGDRKVKLWDVGQTQSQCRCTLTGSNAAITAVEFDASGSLLLAPSNDFATRVWNVDDRRLLHTLTGHSGKVLAARFFRETTSVVTGSYDRTLRIWDLKTRACISTKFAGSSCNDLVTCDGVQIISGHFDKTIRFWDQRSETSHNEIVLQGKITSLDISRDQNSLLACVRDDTLVTLDLRMNHKIVAIYSHDQFHVGCDWTRAAFSSSGQHVAVGSSDGAVFIFNVATTKTDKILKEHSSAVIAVAWHPCDFALVSCDKTKKVVIWSDGCGYQ